MININAPAPAGREAGIDDKNSPAPAAAPALDTWREDTAQKTRNAIRPDTATKFDQFARAGNRIYVIGDTVYADGGESVSRVGPVDDLTDAQRLRLQ